MLPVYHWFKSSHTHTRTLINMKMETVTVINSGVVPTVLTSAKNGKNFTDLNNKHGGQEWFTALGLLSTGQPGSYEETFLWHRSQSRLQYGVSR